VDKIRDKFYKRAFKIAFVALMATHPCTASELPSFREDEVFSPQFKARLIEYSKGAQEFHFAQRILDLELTFEEARLLINKIPYLMKSQKEELLHLLANRQDDLNKEARQKELLIREGFISLGDESQRTVILKKYLYSIVQTEQEYEIISNLLNQGTPLPELYEQLRALAFLKVEEKQLIHRIIDGKFEAFLDPRSRSKKEYRQEISITSTKVSGYAEDLPVTDGNNALYRHHLRQTGVRDGKEYNAEMIVQVGSEGINDEQSINIEHVKIEFGNRAGDWSFGDILPENLSSLVLNQEFRGIQLKKETSGSIPGSLRFFAGGVENKHVFSDILNQSYTSIFGVELYKKSGPERNWTITVLHADEPEPEGNRSSSSLNLHHQTRLSSDWTFTGQIGGSYGNLNAMDRRGGSALDLDFLFQRYIYKADLRIVKYSADWFAPTGSLLEDYTGIYGDFSSTPHWGNFRMGAEWEESAPSSEENGVRLFRPLVAFHWNNALGQNQLHADYTYQESREESDDKLVLTETNTHQLRMMKNIGNYHINTELEFREEYDKTISTEAKKATGWKISTRGFFRPQNNETFSPEVYLSGKSIDSYNGEEEYRRVLGAGFSGTFNSPGTYSLLYEIHETTSNIAYNDQEFKLTRFEAERPFSEDWSRGISLSFEWEEQNLSDNLSEGSSSELKLSYFKDF
jgi:hypothetical protein